MIGISEAIQVGILILQVIIVGVLLYQRNAEACQAPTPQGRQVVDVCVGTDGVVEDNIGGGVSSWGRNQVSPFIVNVFGSGYGLRSRKK